MHDSIIVVPFRNRAAHLEYFVNNTVPLFQKYLPDSKVVVVEQSEGKSFNRGALFFTHDVDLNPTKKCIEEYYIQEVEDDYAIGIYTSRYNTLGGIIKISDKTIQKINGFPNNIWGWGNEDKALQNRAEYFNIKKITNLTNKEEHPQYLLRFDDVNDREMASVPQNYKKHYVDFQRLTREQKLQDIMSSGVNNVSYTIIERKNIHDMVEIIKVII
jgi:hypothetical protein